MTDIPWEATRARLEEALRGCERTESIGTMFKAADVSAALTQLDVAEARALRAEEALMALTSDAWRMQGPRGMNVATFAARALAGEREKT